MPSCVFITCQKSQCTVMWYLKQESFYLCLCFSHCTVFIQLFFHWCLLPMASDVLEVLAVLLFVFFFSIFEYCDFVKLLKILKPKEESFFIFSLHSVVFCILSSSYDKSRKKMSSRPAAECFLPKTLTNKVGHLTNIYFRHILTQSNW